MITAVMADPILLSSAATANSRVRPVAGEHSLLADSAPPAQENPSSSEQGSFPRKEAPPPPPPEQERYSAASMFAAAVIAGNLPPVPTTIEELVMRIGSIPIPPESQARLKDLLA